MKYETMTDSELDAQIGERVMGWQRHEGAGYHSYQDWWKGDPERRTLRDFRPSTDMNEARAVVDKMLELGLQGAFASNLLWDHIDHAAEIVTRDDGLSEIQYDLNVIYDLISTPPRQMCIAALRVIDQQ